MAEREQVIARLARLMQRDDGWLTLIPGAADAYQRFVETINRLPRRERRRARGGMLLELAAQFVDKGLRHGLTYDQMDADLAKIEEGLNG